MGDTITVPRTAQASRRILVAGNDAVAMRLITTILEKEGCSVVPASDGREAYRILHADADFTAAIFDMNMPHLQGLDVIGHMKTEKRLMRTPVMIMTAEQSLKHRAESFAAGALLFLHKPFTAAQMQIMLSILIGKTATFITKANCSWL